MTVVVGLKVSSSGGEQGTDQSPPVQKITTSAARLRRNLDSPQSPPRTPVAAALASPVMTPSVGGGPLLPAAKRARRSQPPPVTLPVETTAASSPPPVNHAFEQWLDDLSNVDISLSVSMGGPGETTTTPSEPIIQNNDEEETVHKPVIATEFCVSIPAMLSRVLQTKLAIDPTRLETVVKRPQTQSSDEVFVSVVVKGREEPITEAIEGGLTPRKAFLRTAPHISRVASRLQECMRQIFGMRDFVVKIDA